MATIKRVLLLRAPRDDSEQDPYQQLFAEKGLDTTSISPLSFEFINLESLYSHITHPEQFSGLVFSSARTVQAVEKCVRKFSSLEEWQEGRGKDWAALPTYTVGTATAVAARELGLTALGEDSGSAVNLVKVIKEGIAPGSKPLLIPRGELAREELPRGLRQAGISYEVDTVYQTICSPTLVENVDRYFNMAVPDVIVFFSPSGVRFSAEVLKRLNTSNTTFISIGPTTTAAMEEQGYSVTATASKPNPEMLMKTLLELTDKVS
ncbi:uroporphyrinogen-III synthase-like isoform X2 [Acanthaster planci]|nr:uroporphyrinogen-III synthase-like isoform X2 [Acanthaster planci]XP_022080561.1 uroporphyrinogen-III synthase-like isoform X2 [Acanthaster planci]XP_022080562.1 uroporphyrinogen-III synthase-like isoform X2 [Acanthaster planci]